MGKVEQLLETAVHAYQTLLAAYGDVEKSVSAGRGADDLLAIMERMTDAAAAAKTADAWFQEITTDISADAGAQLLEMALFEKWLSLVSRVIDENRRIKKYVAAAMAMTKDDLTRMKKSKTAVSGYHSGHGRIITTTGKRINCGV